MKLNPAPFARTIAICLGLSLPIGSGTVAFADQQRLPNIVIILADDLGYGDLACYNDESKVPTPHLDRLASEGMRFTDAHSPSSVCTPTRYGLLTGRYCWRTSLKRWVLWSWDPPLIEEGRLTLPAMLQQHGYHSACIGKWHLGWRWATKDSSRIEQVVSSQESLGPERYEFANRVDFDKSIGGGPTTVDFNYYFGDDVPNFPPYGFIENNRLLALPTATKPREMYGANGPMVPGWKLEAVMPKLEEKVSIYLDERGKDNDGKPFFLYMPLTAPHTPIAPTKRFLGMSQAGRYGDFVYEVDWTVGQVVAAL